MKKAVIRNPDKLKGKSKEEMLSVFGNNYYSEYGGSMWFYIIKKIGFNRKEKTILIGFNPDGIVEEAK